MSKKIFSKLLFLYISLTSVYAQLSHPCSVSKTHGSNSSRRAAVSATHTFLMEKYDVHYYKLDVNVERTSTFISGNVLIGATVKSNVLDTFGFELHPNLNIDSIWINNSNILAAVTRVGNSVSVPLPSSFAQNDNFEVIIFYRGTPPDNPSPNVVDGFSNDFSPSWGNQVTWSLSQPFAAHEWWPCKQVLTDKADSSSVWITTDASNKAGSNGILERVTNLPGNKARYEWKSQFPINYYLISIAVAKYVDYSIFVNLPGIAQPVLIQNFVYDNPQTLINFKNDIDQTADMMEVFSQLFGTYPFAAEKYGHCMAPFSGGMEHQTMTSQGFFEFTLTAHELGHQWFGDLITITDWEHIWLHEGFASYSEYLALENLVSKAAADDLMQEAHDNVMTLPGGSTYVTDITSDTRIFSGRLTYDKGNALVHTLRFMVNDDALFFQAIQSYLNQFRYGNVNTDDLLTVLENETGINFNDFKQQWFMGQGFPNYNVKWNFANNKFLMEVLQTTSMPSVTSFFSQPVAYKISFFGGADTIIRLLPQTNESQYQITFNDSVIGVEVDPGNWLLNEQEVIFDPNLNFVITGINQEAQNQQIFVYPNPASDVLTVSVTHQDEPIFLNLYNALGVEIYTDQFLAPTTRVDISNLSSGVYFIQLKSKKLSKMLKWVKE